MTLQYTLKVKDLIIAGHPHQEIFTTLYNACQRFDELVKKYPEEEIELTRCTETTVSLHKAEKKIKSESPLPVDCPNSHAKTKVMDRSAIQAGVNGKHFCRVCGWSE